MKKKILVVASHPIQYQAPFFKKMAESVDFEPLILFCWDFGTKESVDPEFGLKIKWDTPLLDGYQYKFLKNFSFNPSSQFWGQINLEIIKEILVFKPDFILILGWNSFTNWLSIFTAWILGIPLILKGENPLNQEYLKAKWKLLIKNIILRSFFKGVSAFLYVGKENKKFYEYYGVPQEKLFFGPYAVDNNFFFEKGNVLKDKKEEFRREYGLKPEDTVLLFVGKFIDKKRPQDLLEAYKIALIQNPNLKLLFVGDGELRSDLERSSKNLPGVIFVGFKNQTELPRFYTLADVFVLPSGAGETWGLVVNEAMCFGLPVVVSNVVGCSSDLVLENKTGFIFQYKNVEDLSEKILLSEKLKNNNISKDLVKEYDFSRNLKSLEEIINKK